MVGGLDKFREAFSAYSDCFVIIGGTACEEILRETSQRPRTTLDIDIIVITEKMTPSFARAFWQFIVEGEYRPGVRKNEEGSTKTVLYSFTNGKTGYPIQIELLSRHNEIFSKGIPTHIEPLPIGEDVSSLSAIILERPYYDLTVSNSFVSNGLRYASPAALMALKVRAYLNLLNDRMEGRHINSKDIAKHRNDVMKLAATTILDNPTPVAPEIIETVNNFVQLMKNSLPNQSLQDVLRQDREAISLYLDMLPGFFELGT